MIEKIAVQVLPIVLAVTVHEVAHGLAARRLGDPTAARMGRLSLNPLVHVDLFGTVLFPLMQLLFPPHRVFFGWAKPVPVDARRFANPRRDMMWVALAGPGSNLLQVLIAGLLVHAFVAIEPNLPALASGGAETPLQRTLVPLWLMSMYAVIINTVLAAFNLLPVPPLDGGRVATGLLPLPLAQRWSQLEPYGLFIVLGLIFFVPGVISTVVGPALMAVLTVLQIDPMWFRALP